MRLFFRSALALGLCLGLAACQSEDTVLSPGNPDDPDYDLFMESFHEMDGMVGDVAEEAFSGIDAIMGTPRGSTPSVPGVASQNFTWDEANRKWVGSWSHQDSTGEAVSVTSTVQFWHGATAVQYPDEAQITEVHTATTMDLTSTYVNASAAQEMVIGWGTNMTVNGNMSADASYDFTDGQTHCAGGSSFTAAINDVVLTREGSDCPLSGSVNYTAAVEAMCTGAREGSFAGSWNVTQTFDEGTTTIRVTRGRNFWTVTEPCDDSSTPAARGVSLW